MNSLGSVLSKELQQHNILVQTVTPNQVDTKAARQILEKKVAVSAESYVRYALKTVGKERVTSGHPRHKLLNGFSLWVEQLLGHSWAMSLKMRTTVSARNKIIAAT